jgi:carboxypeptidase C (cathepsin A)
MMFAGAEDLICNYVGIERMIEALHWHGETGFGVSFGIVKKHKLTAGELDNR